MPKGIWIANFSTILQYSSQLTINFSDILMSAIIDKNNLIKKEKIYGKRILVSNL